MSHSISIDTIQHQVHSVCVFQSNRAEIKRNLSVQLKAGQNEVKIEKLPNCLDRDSIRVEGVGNAIIFDVIYQGPPPVSNNEDRQEERKALKEVERKISSLKSDKKICEDQARILEEYGKTMLADKTDATALQTFLDIYSQRKRALHSQLAEVDDALTIANKDLSEKQKVLFEDDESKKRTASVIVVVFAENDGDAELSVSYMVTNASWTPLYDLRAKIPNVQGEASIVVLQYRASISQSTGEDWKDVDLILSTASPLASSEIPELPSFRIGPAYRHRSPMVNKSMAFGRGIAHFSAVSPLADQEESSEDGIRYAMAPAKEKWTPRMTVAVEGVTSTSFQIEGKSTIPSDSGHDQQTHKVSIASIDMQARLEWIAIPKEQASVFLRCQVKNSSQYLLLPGQSSVFMNDNFVCKSWISHVSPQETFSASLGVDPSLKATYHNLQKKAVTNAGNLLGGKYDVTSFVQRITIKNNKQTAVSPLFVKDGIPVSEASAFKVTLNEPKDLGAPKERKEVHVTQGVRARWSFKRDPDAEDAGEPEKATTSKVGSTGGTEEDGVVEWVCSLDAGKAVDITLAYDVNAPVGQTWVRH